MLLNEILSKSIPNLKQSSKAVTDLWTSKQHSVIGVGAQTMAYLHKKFPNKVIKTVQISGTNDPSYQFLRICLKHQNNPWFPKIYTVKEYNSIQQQYRPRWNQYDNLNIGFDDKEGVPPSIQQKTLIVVMEKLQPIPKESITFDFIRQHFSFDHRMYKTLQLKSPTALLFDLFNGDYSKIIYNNTPDDNLKQALRLFVPLFKHYDGDMHPQNIMMRHPNQVVFIDPVQPD